MFWLFIAFSSINRYPPDRNNAHLDRNHEHHQQQRSNSWFKPSRPARRMGSRCSACSADPALLFAIEPGEARFDNEAGLF
jgi:hypothetical protein